MITERHSFEDIHNELMKEMEWMRVFLNKNKARIYRFFLKKSSYPAWSVQKGETPRKNKYILFLECRSKKELSHYLIATHIAWYYNNGGINVAIFANDYDDKDASDDLYIFSPHVFSRYRTRFGIADDVPPHELIELFFQNNLHVDWRKGLAEKHWEGVMKEGILFALRETPNIFHVKTFVTWDMLFENQAYMKNEMYDSLKEMLNTGIKVPEELREKIEGKQTIEDYVKNLKERMKNKKI